VDKGPKRKPDGGGKIKYERKIIYKINGILHKILINALRNWQRNYRIQLILTSKGWRAK